ncbi:MAG: hypothetical protein IKS96_07070 [Fibrobacter sp.]|nr:hypothetical protein [Fibrobacter sp.]MBR6449688.1 hypothetical protein [Fibrobacter sp.]
MKQQKQVKFERRVHAPDGIHDADLRANEIPMTTKDKLYLAGIVLCFLFESTLSYYWG